jgi:two-component system sensor kinase FixL
MSPIALVTAAVMAAFGVLAIDLMSPQGIADPVLYVAVVLIGIWLPWPSATYALSGLATLLTVIGFFGSPGVGDPAVALLNRLLAIFAIWFVAFFSVWRRRLLDQVGEERAVLRAVMDTSADGVVTIDQRGSIRTFNLTAERLFGYAEAEVVGRNVKMLMPEPDRGAHDGYVARYLSTGEKRIIGTGRVVEGQRKDGSRFPIHLMVGEFDRGGERLFTGFLHDMTQRKLAEQRAEQLQQQLYQVGRISELGEMASAIAHELNQPLTAITNYVRAVRQVLVVRGDASPQVTGLIDKAVDQADRAGQIIRRLRQLIGRSGTELQVCDINQVVRDALSLAMMDARSKGIDTKVDLADDLPVVLADRTQIQQVTFNLMRNSIDALEQAERRKVLVSTRSDGAGGAEVSVADSGPGLAEEVAERLFQPFVTTKATGMGIGLSICRSIIEAHEGRIWAERTADGGTVFRFTLPGELQKAVSG